jgi:hypothetical protein
VTGSVETNDREDAARVLSPGPTEHPHDSPVYVVELLRSPCHTAFVDRKNPVVRIGRWTAVLLFVVIVGLAGVALPWCGFLMATFRRP